MVHTPEKLTIEEWSTLRKQHDASYIENFITHHDLPQNLDFPQYQTEHQPTPADLEYWEVTDLFDIPKIILATSSTRKALMAYYSLYGIVPAGFAPDENPLEMGNRPRYERFRPLLQKKRRRYSDAEKELLNRLGLSKEADPVFFKHILNDIKLLFLSNDLVNLWWDQFEHYIDTGVVRSPKEDIRPRIYDLIAIHIPGLSAADEDFLVGAALEVLFDLKNYAIIALEKDFRPERDIPHDEYRRRIERQLTTSVFFELGMSIQGNQHQEGTSEKPFDFYAYLAGKIPNFDGKLDRSVFLGWHHGAEVWVEPQSGETNQGRGPKQVSQGPVSEAELKVQSVMNNYIDVSMWGLPITADHKLPKTHPRFVVAMDTVDGYPIAGTNERRQLGKPYKEDEFPNPLDYVRATGQFYGDAWRGAVTNFMFGFVQENAVEDGALKRLEHLTGTAVGHWGEERQQKISTHQVEVVFQYEGEGDQLLHTFSGEKVWLLDETVGGGGVINALLKWVEADSNTLKRVFSPEDRMVFEQFVAERTSSLQGKPLAEAAALQRHFEMWNLFFSVAGMPWWAIQYQIKLNHEQYLRERKDPEVEWAEEQLARAVALTQAIVEESSGDFESDGMFEDPNPTQDDFGEVYQEPEKLVEATAR